MSMQWQCTLSGDLDYYDTDKGIRFGAVRCAPGGNGYIAYAITWSAGVGGQACWVQIGPDTHDYIQAKRLIESTVRVTN